MTLLGLIGAGAWGQRYVATIAKRSDCRIAAFTTARAVSDARVPGAARCDSWQAVVDLARRGGLDAVIAATTPRNQAEIACAAATAGVPLLVEKPLGASLDEAEGVLRRFGESHGKAPLMVDYVHLFAPAYLGLKALTESSSGGAASITSIESRGYNKGPYRTWSSLWDYGPHDLALCFDLLGGAADWKLIGVERLPSGPGGELLRARFVVGATSFTMTVGNGAEGKARSLTVELRGGRTVTYDDCQPHPRKLRDGETLVAVADTPPLDAVLTHFLSQRQRWVEQGVEATDGARWVELSVRIAGALDGVARALGNPG